MEKNIEKRSKKKKLCLRELDEIIAVTDIKQAQPQSLICFKL